MDTHTAIQVWKRVWISGMLGKSVGGRNFSGRRRVSHPDLRAYLSMNQMCAKTKSHTYDDLWYRNECHIFTI
jgi:hypothetical protein